MIISIDYDDTYTKDPILWNNFIIQARNRGHTVYCITARDEEYSGEEVKEVLKGLVDGIFFTNQAPKEAYMLKYHDIVINCWIDDNPRSIISRSKNNKDVYYSNKLGYYEEEK